MLSSEALEQLEPLHPLQSPDGPDVYQVQSPQSIRLAQYPRGDYHQYLEYKEQFYNQENVDDRPESVYSREIMIIPLHFSATKESHLCSPDTPVSPPGPLKHGDLVRSIDSPGPVRSIGSPGPQCSIGSPGPLCSIGSPGPLCSIKNCEEGSGTCSNSGSFPSIEEKVGVDILYPWSTGEYTPGETRSNQKPSEIHPRMQGLKICAHCALNH